MSVFLLTAFAAQSKKQKFEEIDVERINIVEKDGKLRMIISNQERQHPGIANGKIIKREHPRPPGMIFCNHLGDERGGLIFEDATGHGLKAGAVVTAAKSLFHAFAHEKDITQIYRKSLQALKAMNLRTVHGYDDAQNKR